MVKAFTCAANNNVMAESILFRDRAQAGIQLAHRLAHYKKQSNTVVLALPRGGVPVGFEVAKALQLPLDILLVRKVGFPGHEEYAIGAIASGGFCVMQPEAQEVRPALVEQTIQRELQEIERREALYRVGHPAFPLQNKTVILVDDGLATGATMRVAIKAVKQAQPARIVIAVPVSAPETVTEITDEVDEIVCLATPQPFQAVGLWYRNFFQVSDDEVIALLTQSRLLHKNYEIKEKNERPLS